MNPARWPAVPRRIPVAGHNVHAGWFDREQDEHEIMVRSYTTHRLDLLVVPPETTADEARRLMAAAADPRNPLTADALIAGGPAEGHSKEPRV